jgi:hypothetical protein
MSSNASSAKVKKPMITVDCWWCDEFSKKGPKLTGYCSQAMKPTWPSVYEQCRGEARAAAGEFCWNCCPFTDDHEGCLCGDEGPGVTNIHECQVFNSKLNFALGGESYYSFILVNDRAEIVERMIGGGYRFTEVYDMVRSDLTREWRWLAGWSRYYPDIVKGAT